MKIDIKHDNAIFCNSFFVFLLTVSSKKVPIDTTLNDFIRNYVKLSGTKFMCLEGGCGACVVTVKGIHPVTKAQATWAVNSVSFK
jgi:xanthine dehydrogenase/oxidase